MSHIKQYQIDQRAYYQLSAAAWFQKYDPSFARGYDEDEEEKRPGDIVKIPLMSDRLAVVDTVIDGLCLVGLLTWNEETEEWDVFSTEIFHETRLVKVELPEKGPSRDEELTKAAAAWILPADK